MSTMQTADPRETALRQMCAFYQLMEIIKTLSGPREFRGFTPDEARIMQIYNLAQNNVAQAADKAYASPSLVLTAFFLSDRSSCENTVGAELISCRARILTAPKRATVILIN